MHTVKVFFFATLRDYVGLKAVDIEIPKGATIGYLQDQLVNKYPRLEPVKESMIAAINREFAQSEQVIPEGGEIAFFPPVSGG